jgi:SAM-dependent methyltransferase
VDEDGYFGERIAAHYDASTGEMWEPEAVGPAVGLLAELAGDGGALELGIGTGRIALPLARRGIPVHGIDLSRAMVARLRDKPGGDAIGVTIGDFATTAVEVASGPRIVFNKVPEPKIVKNRVHLDIISDTFEAEAERLLSLGAKKLNEVEAGQSHWITFADIEGNEFDLIAG